MAIASIDTLGIQTLTRHVTAYIDTMGVQVLSVANHAYMDALGIQTLTSDPNPPRPAGSAPYLQIREY